MMKVVDLFCGCGGLSLGFQNAGFDIVAAIDNWQSAIDVYSLNLPHPTYNIDLSKDEEAARFISIYQPDMIIGGPPCQDFSSAGLRNEDNGRGNLTVSFARIIARTKPEWFVMENVSTITKTRKLALAKETLSQAGYGFTQVVLNAALCGVPQRRKRFFLVGKLGLHDGFLSDIITRRLSRKEMTMRDYFGSSIDFQYYYRHPRSYARRGVFSIDEPSPTIRGANRPIPSGYKIHHNDPVSSLTGIRPLTTKERSMIQTFPESFIFSGSKSEIEQMIGNAVPVNLGKFIASCITEYIEQAQSQDMPANTMTAIFA